MFTLKHYKEGVIALSLFVFFLSIYIFFLNDHSTHAHDATTYFKSIKQGGKFYSNHLLYEPLSFFWFHHLRPVFSDALLSDFRLISMMNAFFGSMTISMIYLTVRKNFSLDLIRSIITVFLIGFSFYFLTYSATIEVYVLALFFCFLTYYLIGFKEHYDSPYWIILIGVCHGIAMCMHQFSFLFGFAFLYHLRHSYKNITLYILSGSVIVLGCYLYIFYQYHLDASTPLSIKETIILFKNFFIGFLQTDEMLENNKKLPSYYAIWGLFSAFFGGRFLVANEPLKSILTSDYSEHMYERLIYLHHNTSSLSATLQIIAHICLCVLIVGIIQHYIKSFDKKTLRWDLVALLGVSSLFFMFWYPHNPEFWGIQMICIIILFMLSYPSWRLYVPATIVMMVINILGTAWPLKDTANDLYGSVTSYWDIKKN